jgi:DNA-binding MarR family transcriptional regulator
MPNVDRTAASPAERSRSGIPGRSVDLGPLPGLSGFMLRLAQLAVFGDFIAACGRFDIRPAQYSVLTVIENNPGINQTELSRALAIKRANLVAVIDELERRGLALRRRTARDRRAIGMFLTDRGAALMVEVHAAVRAHEKRVTRRLGKAGRDQLIALLNAMIPDR